MGLKVPCLLHYHQNEGWFIILVLGCGTVKHHSFQNLLPPACRHGISCHRSQGRGQTCVSLTSVYNWKGSGSLNRGTVRISSGVIFSSPVTCTPTEAAVALLDAGICVSCLKWCPKLPTYPCGNPSISPRCWGFFFYKLHPLCNEQIINKSSQTLLTQD